MPDPGQVNIKPQNCVPYIRNNTTAEELAWWRVQRIDPVMRRDQTVHFQLGQKGAVGTTVDSPEFTVTVEHNMHDMLAELVIGGKDPAVDTSYTLGDVLDQNVVLGGDALGDPHEHLCRVVGGNEHVVTVPHREGDQVLVGD